MPTKEKSASARPSVSANRIKKAMAKKGREMNRALRHTGQQIQLKGRQIKESLQQNGRLRKAVAPTVVAAAALAIGGTVAAMQKKRKGNGAIKPFQTENSARSKSRTRRNASSRTGQKTTRSA